MSSINANSIFSFLSCGTHSAGQGYTIEQDLSKNYPECCAKLVKVEKKAKRFSIACCNKTSKYSKKIRINSRSNE